MSKIRKSYTREFKLSVLAQLEAGDKQLVQVARENGIHPSLVTKWRKEHAEDPQNAFGGNGNAYKDKARIAELERMLGKAHAENEFLRATLEKLTTRVQEERKKTTRRRDTQ